MMLRSPDVLICTVSYDAEKEDRQFSFLLHAPKTQKKAHHESCWAPLQGRFDLASGPPSDLVQCTLKLKHVGKECDQLNALQHAKHVWQQAEIINASDRQNLLQIATHFGNGQK